MSSTTTFLVGMTCEGCANAVNRVLKKVPGVEEVDADVEGKKVVVKHSDAATADAMLAALKKWGEAAGKSVELATAA